MADLKFIGVNFPSTTHQRQADPVADRLLVNTIGPTGAAAGPLVVNPVSAVSGTNIVLDIRNGSTSVLQVSGSGTTTVVRPWNNGTDHSWVNAFSVDPSNTPTFGSNGSVVIALGSGVNPTSGSGTDGSDNPPTGSLLLQTNGTAWIKTGAGATSWAQLASAVSSSLQASYDAPPSPDIVQDASGGIEISRGTSTEEYVLRASASSLVTEGRAVLETSLVSASPGSALGVFSGPSNVDPPMFLDRDSGAQLLSISPDGLYASGTDPVVSFDITSVDRPGAGSVAGVDMFFQAGRGQDNAVGVPGGGGEFLIRAGAGGDTSSSTGGVGGLLRLRGGTGGAGGSGPAGAGGTLEILGGIGGSGSSAGNGGNVTVQGGESTTASGTGGNVSIQAGAGTGSDGNISIGTLVGSSIVSGNNTVWPDWNHTGTFSLVADTGGIHYFVAGETGSDRFVISNVGGTTEPVIRITPPTNGSNPNQWVSVSSYGGTGLQTCNTYLSEVSPEGVISAPPSSFCHVRYPSPNANDGVWVKRTGTGNTGWVFTGNVDGPASSTDEAIARFDGVTGKLLQDSNVTIDNSGNVVVPTGNVSVTVGEVIVASLVRHTSDGIESSPVSVVSDPGNPLLIAAGTGGPGPSPGVGGDLILRAGDGGTTPPDGFFAGEGADTYIRAGRGTPNGTVIVGDQGTLIASVRSPLQMGGAASDNAYIQMYRVFNEPSAVADSGLLYTLDTLSAIPHLKYRPEIGDIWQITGSTASPVAIARSNSPGTTAELVRSDHQHDGGQVLSRTVNTTSDTLLTTDDLVLVDVATAGADVTLTLPATANRVIHIKKHVASAWRIILSPDGAETIEGANADYVLPFSGLAERCSWKVEGDGTNWHVFVYREPVNPLLDIDPILQYGAVMVRNAEGSMIVGSPSDGSSLMMQWMPVNSVRWEDRRDGRGPMFLCEEARTNLLLRSEEFDNASWILGGGTTVTPNTARAPDGNVDADTITFTASAADEIYQSATVTDNHYACGSVWLRCSSGTQTVRILLLRKDGSETTPITCNVTTTWTRFVTTGTDNVLTGSAARFIIRNHSDAAARSVFAWGAQLESHVYHVWASSYIRTTTATVARADDIRRIDAGVFNPRMRDSGFTFSFEPVAASSILAQRGSGVESGNFLAWGASFLGYLRFINSGANLTIAIVTQNVTRLTSPTVTFSAGQLLTITVRPSAGEMTLSGFTTGNGTVSGSAFMCDDGVLYIGSRVATSFISGRFSTIKVLPA